VLAKEPGNMRALEQLFSLELHQPGAPGFHAAAAGLLEALCGGRETCRQACQVYRQYCAAAKPQRLSAALYVKIGLSQIEAGELGECEKLFSALLRQKPDTHGLPAALLKLAGGLRKKGEPDKAARWLEAICARYPQSPQARVAATALAAAKTAVR
jgi:predicted Zn-dependent protease